MKTFKEEILPTLFKLFHKIEREVTWHNSFYETSVIPILEPNKDTSKKNCRPIF
jgi:hypothetical protein